MALQAAAKHAISDLRCPSAPVPTSSGEGKLGGLANLSPAPFSLSRRRLGAVPLHSADHKPAAAAQSDSDAGALFCKVCR